MQARMSACNKSFSTENLLEGEMMELPDFLDRTSQISEHVRSKCGKTTGTAAGLECRQDILLSVGLFLSFRIPGHFNPAPASGGDGGGSCLGSRVVLPKQGQVGGTA